MFEEALIFDRHEAPMSRGYGGKRATIRSSGASRASSFPSRSSTRPIAAAFSRAAI
jgi:hypothetical protein